MVHPTPHSASASLFAAALCSPSLSISAAPTRIAPFATFSLSSGTREQFLASPIGYSERISIHRLYSFLSAILLLSASFTFRDLLCQVESFPGPPRFTLLCWLQVLNPDLERRCWAQTWAIDRRDKLSFITDYAFIIGKLPSITPAKITVQMRKFLSSLRSIMYIDEESTIYYMWNNRCQPFLLAPVATTIVDFEKKTDVR